MMRDDVQAAFATGYEEAVEVDQRSLIEKILARYSGEYTVFRELLQNADDAQASSVEVHFQSQAQGDPSLPLESFKTNTISQIVVKNDGIVFREEDWRRLTTIASGQPNVESIGAFGVGFYSIWSLSDEPHVVSGDQMMLFFWKGQQLAVKRAKNPHTPPISTNGRPWSSITMPCRSPEPMPDPATFSRFMATALPFTSHINHMSLHYDGTELCRISKTPASSRPLDIPRSIDAKSAGRMMTLTTLEIAPLQLTCIAKRITLDSLESPVKKLAQSVKQSFATKFLSFATSAARQIETPQPSDDATQKVDKAEELSATLFLRIVTAQAKLTASKATIAEIERSTKKPPPPTCKLRVLFASKEESDASRPEKSGSVNVHSLFSQLTTDIKTQGKIYIGFPLFQTTGCSSAISGRFIPTVEREQIDLQAKAIADYNRELLSISGIVCRVIYDTEMADLALRWTKVEPADALSQKLVTEAGSFLMQNFTFYQSTPIAVVGRCLQSSFFACNSGDFLLISTRGILSAKRIRLPASELAFLTDLATVPDAVAADTGLLLDQLQERGILQSVTIDDVIEQLNAKPLSAGLATSALQWWIGLAGNVRYDPRLMPRFRDALVITATDEGAPGVERVIPLSMITTYLNPKNVPPDLPLPLDVLPHSISRSIPWQDLTRVFGFTELTVARWVAHLATGQVLDNPETSITLSPAFSERILNVLAKVWMNLRNDQTAQIAATLEDLSIISTRKGMVKAREAYLPKVTLFDDMPIISFTVKGSMEKMLINLGVRDHVDLQLVFSRLLGAGSWDQEQVAKYLVSVSANLSTEETEKLKKTAWLTKEQPEPPIQADKPTKPARFKAVNLYEPSDALRNLDLPIVSWSAGKWRPQSEEAKFLYKLGLKKQPTVEDLLIMASDESVPERQTRALNYFLEHYDSSYASSYNPAKQDLAFVPVLHKGERRVAKPSESYTSAGAAIMGFSILHPDYQAQSSKFKLLHHPQPTALVKALVNAPPGTHSDARPVFAYLATQASKFSAADYNTLLFARIVPVQDPETRIWTLSFPRSVYLSSNENQVPEAFRSLFTFVDYGATANAFLLQIGVRNEPTGAEMTQMLLGDPRRTLTMAGSAEKYISLLRLIAAQAGSFPNSLRKKMQSTPFLIGFERVREETRDPKSKTSLMDDDDDEEGLLQYRLALAADVVVVDDTTLVNDFKDHILACPQDDIIEAFVENLGGRRISQMVSTTYSSTSIPETSSSRATSLRKLVLERVALFLHERPQTSKDVRVTEEWLKQHLRVREVARIERQRVLTIGGDRIVKSSPSSAAATMEKGHMLLRISASFADLDYYEVAAALTRLILVKQKIHDTLLFMTLLQTSLRDLKRRGFNVDKITNARKAEQEALDKRLREERAQADRQRLINGARDKADPPAYEPRSSVEQPRETTESRRASISSQQSSRPPPSPSQGSKGLFSSIRQKLRGNPLVPPEVSDASPDHDTETAHKRQATEALEAESPKKTAIPDDQVTPKSNINANVLKAVTASRPDRSGNISSQIDAKEVKESSSYCDSTPAKDLVYVTEVSGVRFYVSRSVDEDHKILSRYGQALTRYVEEIVKPVGRIYNVDPRALHVFYDTEGPLIAFNRSGSLFFNLRYHIAWHGAEMQQGQLETALISTYFSMAHELAHNLVQPHNSEHSFYTSQLAQTFFVSMAAYIARVANSLQHEAQQ